MDQVPPVSSEKVELDRVRRYYGGLQRAPIFCGQHDVAIREAFALPTVLFDHETEVQAKPATDVAAMAKISGACPFPTGQNRDAALCELVNPSHDSHRIEVIQDLRVGRPVFLTGGYPEPWTWK